MASFSGSYKINTVIAHTAPAVLELLQGGVARSKNDIIAALAGRYSKNDITHTLMRLSVTGRLIETGRKYGLPDSTNDLRPNTCCRADRETNAHASRPGKGHEGDPDLFLEDEFSRDDQPLLANRHDQHSILLAHRRRCLDRTAHRHTLDRHILLPQRGLGDLIPLLNPGADHHAATLDLTLADAQLLLSKLNDVIAAGGLAHRMFALVVPTSTH
jgi:hypothetical protein